MVLTQHAFNVLQQGHPGVLETLANPNWYFDRKGEIGDGADPWYRSSVIHIENDASGPPRVRVRFDPNNVTSLARFNSGPDARIPALSGDQERALQVFEATCARLALHMILDPGDIQPLSNTHVFHARTAYRDHPPGPVDEEGRPRVRGHLTRLWLAVPESEGGWKLPFHDSNDEGRRGIQVDDTPPVCPPDAE